MIDNVWRKPSPRDACRSSEHLTCTAPRARVIVTALYQPEQIGPLTATAQSTAATAIDVAALRRREFPRLEGTYLNAASVTPLPERARRAAEAYTARRSSPGAMTGDDFEPTLHRARAAAARLVNATPEEIALQPNTSHGINLAAQVLPVQPGRRILLSGLEFPANVYPWLSRERQDGTPLTIIPTDALGRPDEARLLEELARGDVGIFALSAVQFATGWAADLERFGRACREHGAYFVVDAIQGAGCVPIDVRAARIDVLATGGQKWLCAPFGTGFAYVRRELISTLEPRVVGWTAMKASADYADCCAYAWELPDTAQRFEVATQAFHDLAGFTESVGLLVETGVERIHAHVTALQDPLAEWLMEREEATMVSDLTPGRRSGILCFRFGDTAKAYSALHRAGVHCVVREGAIRIAPHLYNDADDVARVMEVLAGVEAR